MNKNHQLYLECETGISGDMTVAALLDLGADEQALRDALASLPIDGFEIRIGRVKKSGLDACDFSVILDHEHENHDHDMAYLHGTAHEHIHEHHHPGDGDASHDSSHSHAHSEEQGETAEDGHGHGEGHSHEHGHSHHHEHRGMREIREIIGRSSISGRAKETALHIFEILGEAEAKAHGETLDTVHFHEVGAVDSIVDIVATAVCLDNLGIGEVIVPFLCEGGGSIRCAHGILPVPVPAVTNIVAAHGLKLRMTGMQGEYVTPTGAAIAAAVCTSDRLPQEFVVERFGLGAGKRDYQRPGLLRAFLIRDTACEASRDDEIWKLESNVDDASGENFGYVMNRLLEAGARDVFYIPVYMKKNRPAYMLSVLCDREKIPAMEDIIFRETTTIGIRRNRMERTILARRLETVQTPFGEATVKICELPHSSEETDGDTMIRCYPEYESVVRLCREHGLSYGEAYDLITGSYQKEKSCLPKSGCAR
ncbi:MAG: nickel pincer cofactor biosynthesis protein LarC [Clostridiales bacterium]|nr:nickel pincer cofactor biosynthesis protein LarC [Clostridiales bacterium]